MATHGSSAQEQTATFPGGGTGPAPANPTAEPAPPLEAQFLVKTETGEVVRRSSSSILEVLAEGVLAATLDPAFDLLWLQMASDLAVLDLRESGARPVRIATGITPPEALLIEREQGTLKPENDCGQPPLHLEWSDEPVLHPSTFEERPLPLVGMEWLRAQQRRAPNPGYAPPDDLLSTSSRVKLPKRALDCDEPGDCGAAVPFGSTGLELVLTVDRDGGDCVERACLLRDPSTERFATPPDTLRFTTAEDARPGPCGPYRFDRAGLHYLDNARWCEWHGDCRSVGGEPLGWLAPGRVVGSP